MNGVVDLHDADILTEFRERSTDQFTDVRDGGIPWNTENAGMEDDIREARLAAFKEVLSDLLEKKAFSSLNDWCEKSGMRQQVVGEFLSGKTRLMNDRTYKKLSQSSGIPVHTLKGDAPPTSDVELSGVAEHVDQFSRLSPEDKERVRDLTRRLLGANAARSNDA